MPFENFAILPSNCIHHSLHLGKLLVADPKLPVALNMIAIVQDYDSVPVPKSRQRQDQTKFQGGVLTVPKPKEQDKICLGIPEFADP